MALDMLSIGDALALRYAAVSVTPPTGYTNIRGSTARVPNNIPATPYVLVHLPRGEFIYEGGRRHGEHVFDVWFLYAKASGDLPRDHVGMYKWLAVLIDQLHGQTKLGISTVMKALLEGVEPASYEYAGDEYHAWHLTVRVWTEDNASLTP